jgi:hypothetical protein
LARHWGIVRPIFTRASKAAGLSGITRPVRNSFFDLPTVTVLFSKSTLPHVSVRISFFPILVFNASTVAVWQAESRRFVSSNKRRSSSGVKARPMSLRSGSTCTSGAIRSHSRSSHRRRHEHRSHLKALPESLSTQRPKSRRIDMEVDTWRGVSRRSTGLVPEIKTNLRWS